MKTIEIRDISKKFGEHVVLNHITVRFQEGSIYGIVGRNGSGKTVLLECICGLIHQDIPVPHLHKVQAFPDIQVLILNLADVIQKLRYIRILDVFQKAEHLFIHNPKLL